MTWTEDAAKAIRDNPHYFAWWYSAKSIGLAVVAAVAAYYIGRDRQRRGLNGSPGGRLPCRRGWKHGRAVDMDPEQLARGIKAEREHFSDDRRACRTAVDHLAERADYYEVAERAGL